MAGLNLAIAEAAPLHYSQCVYCRCSPRWLLSTHVHIGHSWIYSVSGTLTPLLTIFG
jgi:hypothetical protein